MVDVLKAQHSYLIVHLYISTDCFPYCLGPRTDTKTVFTCKTDHGNVHFDFKLMLGTNTDGKRFKIECNDAGAQGMNILYYYFHENIFIFCFQHKEVEQIVAGLYHIDYCNLGQLHSDRCLLPQMSVCYMLLVCKVF